jgi:hypothetical protein
MFLVTLWVLIQTFIFLPLAGGSTVAEVLPFLVESLLLATALALSLAKKHLAALACALVVLLGVVAYWWFVISGGRTPIWPDFKSFVVPDAAFLLATLIRWFALALFDLPTFDQQSTEAPHV